MVSSGRRKPRGYFSAIPGGAFKTLKENDKVQYDVGQGAKGPNATNVKPA